MLESKLFDASEQLSKVFNEILRTGTAVFITKNNILFGLIDDRNMRIGIANASKMKCENACVKCPAIAENASILECINAFLSGHFKALPVLNAKKKIVNAISRVDVLKELSAKRLIPRAQICRYMNAPVCTIETEQSVADAKSKMKKFKVHHLVVTQKGNIVGIISTFDFVGLFATRKERQSYQLISEIKNFDSKKINEIYRENFVTLDENATLDEAVLKMIDEDTSSIIIVANKKPVGVLTAMDIFKLVRKLCAEERDISINGLDNTDAEVRAHYDKIKQYIINTVNKFDRSFKIENIAIHMKKGKGRYEARAQFYLNNKQIAFKCEAYSLGEIASTLSSEFKTILEKRKSEKMEKKKRSPVEDR